jgi:hypothetical protein
VCVREKKRSNVRGESRGLYLGMGVDKPYL